MTVKWEVDRNSWISHPLILCFSDTAVFILKDNKIGTVWPTVSKEDTVADSLRSGLGA